MDQNRYQRQLQLPGFGIAGQQKLAQAKVLVVGAGGLGVPVLQYLAAMGVGIVGIVDADTVSLSNLHRQVIYSENDIGKTKVDCCAKRLREQNPDVQIQTHTVFLSPENALFLINEYDVVVDATDNFVARYLINDACVILNKPFVYGALQYFEGHLSVFNFQDGPTYRCLYPTPPDNGQIPDCNAAGVLGIVPGLIGSYQALEAIKLITGIGTPLSGVLQVFDFLDNSYYHIKLVAKEDNKRIRQIHPVYENQSCADEESISPKELMAWITAGKSFSLLDVREKNEYTKSHLQNAISLPLSQLNGKLTDLPKDSPYVILCQQGGRSQKAISHLKEKHPDLLLLNLEGGLSAWTDALGNEFIVNP